MAIETIQIDHPKSIKGTWRGYVCEPSVEAAVQQFIKSQGYEPSIAYYKVQPSGRMTVYIPVNGGET